VTAWRSFITASRTVAAALVLAACQPIGSPGPTPGGSATPAATLIPPPVTSSPVTPSAPPPSPSPLARTLVCGAPGGPSLSLAECLRALGPAWVVLGGEDETADRITVTFTNPVESQRRQLRSATVGTATITVYGQMPAEWLVDITGPGFDVPIRVYEGSGVATIGTRELGLGAAPKQVREYRVDGDVRRWTDPDSFELEAFTYDVTGNCFGRPDAPASGTVVLERVREDGTAVEVYRATCGPSRGGNAMDGFVTVTAGTYRVRLESVQNPFDVTIWPRATWR
jgi:hypothetical protein